MPLGAHVVFVRRIYEHHALYAGNGKLLQYTDASGVHETSFAEVRETSRYWILGDGDRRHPALFAGPEALQRARRRMGEMMYSRSENNCEHLVNWALSGHHHCDQTDTDQGVVYCGFGFVSWMISKRKAAWHRARLQMAYQAEHRAAARRYAYFRELRDLGMERTKAAAATRLAFSIPEAKAA